MQLRLFGRSRVTSKVCGLGKEMRVVAVAGGGFSKECNGIITEERKSDLQTSEGEVRYDVVK